MAGMGRKETVIALVALRPWLNRSGIGKRPPERVEVTQRKAATRGWRFEPKQYSQFHEAENGVRFIGWHVAAHRD